LASFAWKNLFKDVESQTLLKYVIIIHIVSWIFQFIGHGVFESKNILKKERKPALMDNIGQILSAPLFVTV
jgi:uncharacterized membrane protein YGL010W